ncbi:MAG: MATE family efflux transporter [Oscillospiraceae bacterium]
MQKLKENKILFQFLRYASLNVLGMIGLSCYILADTFFIAKGLGSNGLAALNIAIPVYSFIYGLGLMCGIGAATRYAILKQNKESKQTNSVFTQSVMFVLMLSAIFFSLGLFLSKEISTLLGASDAIVGITNTYLRIILLFAPIFMLNELILCFVRNDGNPRLAMISMLIGSLSNIILDYIFVIKLGTGMTGAALATGIAPVVGLIVSSMHFIKKRNNFKFVKTRLRLAAIKDMISLGTGALVNELSSGIVIIVFNFVILRIAGDIGVAAYAIIANIAVVVVSIFTGIAQGMQPLVSSNYGKGNKEGVVKTYRYGLITAISFATIIYLIAFFLAEPITAVFNEENNAKLTEIAVYGIRIYFTAIAFVGINIITSIFFSSIDKPKQAVTISLLRAFLLIVPITITMATLFSMTGVWLSLLISEVITLIISMTLYYKNKKQMA